MASLLSAAQALAAGGLLTIEFSYTGEVVLEALGEARKRLARPVVLGVGTVLDPSIAQASSVAGAEFIVSPSFRPATVEVCREAGAVAIPGAATPTEILNAWEAGADLVKVFPANVYGPRFFRDVRAPLPQIPLLAVGGVTIENAVDFLEAGAVAVGMGSALVGQLPSSASGLSSITSRVQALLGRIGEYESALTS